MNFLSRHKASVITVAISLGILVGLALLVPSTNQPGITVEGIEGSGSRIDFPTEPITLTYWRTLDGVTPFADILKDYKQLHPNVDIKLTNVKYADYDKTLTEAAKAGKLPDLYSIKEEWMPRYQQSLMSSPTTVYTPGEFKDEFVPVVSDRLISGQSVNGVALGVSTLGLFYNETLLTQQGYKTPPRTWQELMDYSRKLTKRSGSSIILAGVALGDTKVVSYKAVVSALMQQNGAVMTDTPPTQATFNKPDASGYPSAAKAVSFYTGFARPASDNYSWANSLGTSLEAFKAGKAAMMIDYAYRAPEIDADSPDLKYKMAALPQVNTGSPTNQAEFWAELVSKNTRHADVAWDFLRFAATRTQMNRYNIATYRPAARKDLVKDQQTDKYLGPFAKQVGTAKTWYQGNSYNVDGIFADMISAVLAGGASQPAVDTAATRTTQEIVTSK